MVRFLTLLNFTDQGIRNVGDTIKRAVEFRQSVEAAGGTLVSQYWSVGDFDGCVVLEVPNETVGASLLLSLANKGNVRTRTLQVFNTQEFEQVLSKI